MTAAARMKSMDELAELIREQDKDIHRQVERNLQTALDQRDEWHLNHAAWVARHLRRRSGFEQAITLITQTAVELEARK